MSVAQNTCKIIFMKRLLVELESLPEVGKKYSGELDAEIFGIDDEEVTSIGPLAFDVLVQRFENELVVRGNISAPFRFRCVRCLECFDYVVEVNDFAASFNIDAQSVIDVSDAMREEIVLDFPAYPKCVDGGKENDCMAKTPYFGVDKEGGMGVNSSAPSNNSGVWDALDELGDHH